MELNYIPELSDELEFSKISNSSYIVSSAQEKHYVKINQDTYNLILLIDGEKSLTEICVDFNQKYQREINPNAIANLLNNSLAQYGFLKGFAESIKPYQKPSYLKLSYQILNENAVSKSVKFFHFLFDKWIGILLVGFSLSIVAISLFSNLNLYQNFNLAESALVFISFATMSLLFHELGHATATSYFGINHGGIGIGFYLLTPVFYADVTGVWHLPKHKRIIVNLAGVYFELLFCSLVILCGTLLNSNSIVIVSITIFARTLFNLNPFLRSDGYWILADLLEVPNLMTNSSQKLNDVGKLILGEPLIWNSKDFFLFIYAILSHLVLALFLFYVLFVNQDSILLFPNRIVSLFINLQKGNFNVSFMSIFELLIPITLIFLAVRNVKSYVKILMK